MQNVSLDTMHKDVTTCTIFAYLIYKTKFDEWKGLLW